MKNYSIAGRTVVRYRRKLLFWRNFVSLLLFVLLEGALVVFALYTLQLVNFGELPSFIPAPLNLRFFKERRLYDGLIYAGVGLVFLGLILLIRHLQYRSSDRKYRKRYLEILFEEAHLHDLNLFVKNNPTVNDFEKEEAKMLGYNSFKYLSSYSDASTDTVIEMTQVRYTRKNNGYGLLITTYLDQAINGFMQLRKCGVPGIQEYRDKAVLHFGHESTQFLRNCAVFSTLERETYKLLRNGLESSVFAFGKFVQSNWIVTYYDNRLVIMLDGWRLRLMRPLKWKPRPNELDTQVEGLKKLHQQVFMLIDSIKNWNIGEH